MTRRRPLAKAGPKVSDGPALFNRANQLYNKGEYDQAAALFQKLADQKGFRHFATFYNLGNSYFRLQRYGLALAYYRKAQRLKPNDMSLLHNIQLLIRRTGKNEQTVPGLRVKFLFWYYLMNLQQLFFLVLLITCLGLLLWGVHIRRASFQEEGGLRWYVVAAMSLVVMLWVSLGLKVYREELRQLGVVTQSRVTARSGYGAHFEPMFRLSEADEVLIRQQLKVKTAQGKHELWYRIELYLYDKKKKRRVLQVGWVPGRAVKKI